jgi:hypothetical protein
VKCDALDILDLVKKWREKAAEHSEAAKTAGMLGSIPHLEAVEVYRDCARQLEVFIKEHTHA